jgi:hypothetical protein
MIKEDGKDKCTLLGGGKFTQPDFWNAQQLPVTVPTPSQGRSTRFDLGCKFKTWTPLDLLINDSKSSIQVAKSDLGPGKKFGLGQGLV